MKWLYRLVLSVLAVMLCLAVAVACVSQPQASTPEIEYGSFQAYLEQSRQWVQNHRHFQTRNREDELTWNTPFETRLTAPTQKAILLVHGLGDSPSSFADVAGDLASQGYVVRTVLLSGHGTKPDDLIAVRLEDWQNLVRQQVALLHQEFQNVYLGGFSTGANLVLEYAMNDPQIRGLLLFSPAIRSSVPVDWASPWLARVKTWVLPPNDSRPQQSPVRYHNIPTNGFAQFYRSSVAVRQQIENKHFDRPVVIVLSEHDSVVDVHYVRELFEHRFTHQASRLIWYGQEASISGNSKRILVRSDALPQERISQFSHMGILFSPKNPLYGRWGTERLCWNGQTEQDMRRCQSGEPVWFSDWGYREVNKVHARLTFNPYFDWQSHVIHEVLGI